MGKSKIKRKTLNANRKSFYCESTFQENFYSPFVFIIFCCDIFTSASCFYFSLFNWIFDPSTIPDRNDAVSSRCALFKRPCYFIFYPGHNLPRNFTDRNDFKLRIFAGNQSCCVVLEKLGHQLIVINHISFLANPVV